MKNYLFLHFILDLEFHNKVLTKKYLVLSFRQLLPTCLSHEFSSKDVQCLFTINLHFLSSCTLFIFIQPFYQPRHPSALFFNHCSPPSICFYQNPSALAFHASQCLQDDQKAARWRSKDSFICQSLSTYQISDLAHGKSRAFGKQAPWCIKCLTAEERTQAFIVLFFFFQGLRFLQF